MKLALFFLFNILFPNSLSEWIHLNNHIIDSKSYKISLNQKIESIIGESNHFMLDTNVDVIFFKDQIRYESSDRIIIMNKDSLKLLNKKNNQLFIDEPNVQSVFLFKLSLLDLMIMVIIS